nr:retrotransposon Orf1 [Tanacetum cinerariifolium]
AYKAGLASVEARLEVYKKNEAVFEDDIKILKLDVMLRDKAIIELRQEFEKAKRERDDLKLTLEKFEGSSKNLSRLLDSQQRNYMPPKPDFVLADEHIVSEFVTSLPDIAKSEVKTSETELKNISAPIIEDWVSNGEDKNEIETEKSVKQKESNRQIKYHRKTSQSPRGNQKNWNNLMTQRLRDNFEFKSKACYECGSFNHVIKNCDSYKKKKMVEKSVWNNARRVNHQNSQRLSHPHSKRNFVPKAVLTNSCLKTLNIARHPSSRAAVSVSTARPINTAYPRSTVNGAKLSSNVFHKSHSPVRRTFNLRTFDLKEKVNTAKTQVSNGLGLQEKLILLFCMQEIDGGFVAFGGSPKGGKISGKGRGPEWLFNIDSLTNSMSYELVTAGNQTNNDAGIEINVNAGQARQEKASDHEYILLPFKPSYSPLSLSTQSSDDKDVDVEPGKGDEGVSKGSEIDDQERTNSSTQDVNTTGPSINTANKILYDHQIYNYDNQDY